MRRFSFSTARSRARARSRAVVDSLEPRIALSDGSSAPALFAPTDFQVTIGYREAPDGATTRAHLTWTDTNSDETGYRIEYSVDNGFVWDGLGADLLANSTSTVHVLNAGQKLHYRVRAVNGPFVSDPTAAVSPITPIDRAVQVQAIVYGDTIHLTWPYDPEAASYNVYRKDRAEESWTLLTSTPLPSNCVGYAENVTQGQAFEYQVERVTHNFYGPLDGSAFGYVYAGNKVALTESRGRVLLVVDQTRATGIAAALTRYRRDLLADGWTVQQILVPRDNGDAHLAESVKAQIRTAALSQPGQLKSIVLIGHVPVPYSGKTAWDGHGDHTGAWPADGYYGEGIGMLGSTGTWTDVETLINTGHPDNNNLPGDGKFDQDNFPGNITVPVGRIDFANLPGMRFSFNPVPVTDDQSESMLLVRYFDKNHAWRTRATQVGSTAIVDDHLGGSAAENGWRGFAPLVGDMGTKSADWKTTMSQTSNLWSSGLGPGAIEYVDGVATIYDLHTPSAAIFSVFNVFSGSWFGDWNKQSNLLREVAAANGTSLTAMFVGTPNVYLHTMGLGETIGQAMMLSQNNRWSGPYSPPSTGQRATHMGLMGDPTLTMSIAPPVSNLTSSRVANANTISWTTPADSNVTGFHVYRASSPDGPFYRLNSSAIPSAGVGASMLFNDPAPMQTFRKFTYMVRAIKLQTTPSGKFENASWGQTVQSQPMPFGNNPAQPPAITAPQPTAPVNVFSSVSADKLQPDPLDDLGL